MSRILTGQLGKQLAVFFGCCLLALFAAPLVAEERVGDTEPQNISRWGPISISGKTGSFEVDIVTRLFVKGLYTELEYGDSDLDLPPILGGGEIDVSYWSVGLRGYPWVEHGVGSFDFAFFVGAGIGVYDLESSLAPLTGAKSGFNYRAGLEIRYSNLPQLGFEVEWASHEIDVGSGTDLDFDGFLFGFRYHWGTDN